MRPRARADGYAPAVRRSHALLALTLLVASAIHRLPANAEPPRALPTAPAAWEPARTYALLIGVLEWQTSALSTFPKQARVDRVLEATLYDRGVPRDHVTFLEDGVATLARCREALRTTAARAGPGSTLLLYYAGHGLRAGEKTYFAPYDVDPKDVARTGLGHDEIARTLASTWKGSRLLLLADCCESGGLGAVVAGYRTDVGPKAASLTSAMETHVSTGNWTFTASVVKVLTGEGLPDLDGDGAITFDETDRFVSREMRWRESQWTSARRTPSFEPGFVLAKVRPGAATRRVPGPRPIGDYAEVEWRGTWWRGQVLDVDAAGRTRIRYLGYDASDDEWVEPVRLRDLLPSPLLPGARVEVSASGTWWPAVVRETRAEFALVHYEGYAAAWDEWVAAHRLRPVKGP